MPWVMLCCGIVNERVFSINSFRVIPLLNHRLAKQVLRTSSIVFVVLFVIFLREDAWAQNAAEATVSIDASNVEGEISPILYGQFDEFMFGGVKGGLSAELLQDRSFDGAPNTIGLPRYWERDPDDRNDDPALHFHWDAEVFYPPTRPVKTDVSDHSLRIDLAYDNGQRRGIRQGGIPIRHGLAYVGYFWAKTEDFQGTITAALEADRTGGERYASAEIHDVQGTWRKYDFVLTPTTDDPLAKLAILFHGKGRLWIDQISLVPGDAVHAVRADVFGKLNSLHPAFIRWPGGNVAQDYHWVWGTGPKDERPAWVNLSWANELEPGDFGTDEFVQLCRDLGAEPSLTVNVEGRGATAEEAANWVEYANGPATSKFGALRAANGHPDPYRVRYWEIGNEIWGDWVRGHSDAKTYATNLGRYARALRAVDPSIQLIGVGDNDLNWNRTVLKSSGSQIDYLAVHHYYGEKEMQGDVRNLMARPLHYEHFYQEMKRTIAQAVPGRKIQLAVNEWNTTLPLPGQHSMLSAVYAARLMNVFERSDIVGMSAPSDMVNGWSGGLIQASRHDVFLTPTFLANQMYAEHLGRQRLSARVQSPTFDTSQEGRSIPFLDVVVSRSSDGKQIYIKAVNTDLTSPLRTTIEIKGASIRQLAHVDMLAAASLETSNSFSKPDVVAIHRTDIQAGSHFTLELPKQSVSVITLELN
jgi:alpha-N-arabinofuranosidase